MTCFKRFNRSAATMARWCVAACLASLSLHASALERYGTTTVEMVGGKVEGWVYAESKDEVGDFPSKGEITLNGKVIKTTDEVVSIHVTWGYPEKDPASIAMLSLNLPYPDECIAQFVLVETRKGEAPIITEPFGNCNDDAKAEYKFGQVVVYFPKFGPGKAKAETAFVYENSKLRRVKVTKEIRKGTWTAPIK